MARQGRQWDKQTFKTDDGVAAVSLDWLVEAGVTIDLEQLTSAY